MQRFLHDELSSVRDLDALLRLRAGGARLWTSEALSADLRSTPRWAAQQLADLRSRGLVEAVDDGAGPAYRYAPADPARSELVDCLAELYERRRATVIALIFGREMGVRPHGGEDAAG